MASYYPPAAFYFEVKVTADTSDLDASFAEVSGLDAEREILEVREGGENRFSHRLPGRARATNLVLKRGLMVASSPLFDWCKSVLESDLGTPISPRDLDISLLDPEGSPLVTWNVQHAWPTKWTIGTFNATDNSVAMETLELACREITREQVRKTGISGLF